MCNKERQIDDRSFEINLPLISKRIYSNVDPKNIAAKNAIAQGSRALKWSYQRPNFSLQREKWLWQPLIVFSRVCFLFRTINFDEFQRRMESWRKWGNEKVHTKLGWCLSHTPFLQPNLIRKIYAHDEINYSPWYEAVNSKVFVRFLCSANGLLVASKNLLLRRVSFSPFAAFHRENVEWEDFFRFLLENGIEYKKQVQCIFHLIITIR